MMSVTRAANPPGQKPRRFLLFLAGSIATTLAASACMPGDQSLNRIKTRGELIVLTRNAPTTYYEGREGYAGLEYDMARAFAAHLGVEARFIVKDGVVEMLEALSKGEGDIVAAGLTRTGSRASNFLFGPSYQSVRQQVVCRRGGKQPKFVEELDGVDLMVTAGSSYAERLQTLQKVFAGLVWQEAADVDTEQLLEMVWDKKIDCAVADSNIVRISRRYFPELVVTFDLTEPEPLAWAMAKQSTSLKRAIDVWFDVFRTAGEIDKLLERYYGHIPQFDFVGTRAFNRRIGTILPRYLKDFRQAGRKYGMDWTLLAAQAYQESQWHKSAESPTGVKGIMMLTLSTAEDMGVEDRLDPKQSIMGGAKYLSRMIRGLPDEVAEPDRTWIALAAYNVGMGHIRDAMALARSMGRDPYLWSELSEILPLLSKKRYYKTLDHGYARGYEAVYYVKRIRHFQDILERASMSGEDAVQPSWRKITS